MRKVETIQRDLDTGEILDNQINLLKSNERIETNVKNILTPGQKSFFNRNSELHQHSKKLGGYVHMSYKENTTLFSDTTLDKTNISRLIYLSTFLDFNDREENLLVKVIQNNKRVPMNREDIQKVLLLKDTTFKSFLRDMRTNNMLYEVNGKFYLNTDYFNRGNSKYNTYTRVFINTIRDLYSGVSARQHKLLGQAFQLIPFLHYDSNVLCKNPKEIDYTKREKLTLEDIATILGTSTDRSNLSKLKKSLESLTVNVNGDNLPLFKYVPKPYDYFVINSYVIWSGTDVSKMKENIQFYFFS